MHEHMLRLPDVWRTCNKVRAAVFRVGLDLFHWFLPLDPEGNRLISESNFVCVLAGPLKSVIGLSNKEISQLTDYFRTQDGRILYHQFCELIHGEDGSRMDKSSAECVLEACPPPPEPACHALDGWQLRRLCCLLATIADREIPLKPYFQDYELVTKFDGRITFAHFNRILNFMGILISKDDFNLLVRRFVKDSYTIDYVAFIKAVEAVKREGIQGLGPDFKHPAAVIDTTPPKTVRPELQGPSRSAELAPQNTFHPALERPRRDRDLVSIMLRVQEFVKQRGLRVSEFFRDYDPLNCGRIAPLQFRRALDNMGVLRLLSTKEALCLITNYIDPNDNLKIMWRTFEDDCDQVFTTKELEKHPTLVPGESAARVQELPAAGSLEDGGGGGAAGSARQLDACESALQHVRAAVTQRSLDLRAPFRDHDLHNNGHVSRAQVARVLARAGLLPSSEQVRALETRYLDDCGFNYFKMLDELGDTSEERPAHMQRPTVAAQIARSRTKTKVKPEESDIVLILAKIKGKVVREGLRPRQFLQQHDKLNEGIVSRADFYRSLATAGLSLTPTEMDTLMEVFAAPARRRFIEYTRFCNTVGEALTQEGLERAPLLVPVAHVPTRDARHNFLTFEERSIVSAALAKLAKYPDQVSNILDVFKDMDVARCGTVSQQQCEQALCRRGLLHLLSRRERLLVYKCFGFERGCRDEVDYRGLCNALDLIFANNSMPC